MTVLPLPPSSPAPEPRGRAVDCHKALSFALVFLTALLVASWTGFIVWASTQEVADAVLQSGVAFASTVGLCLAVWAAYRQR
ncbi:hypothetical protein OOJ91_33715 [Micromonospora lupini]|uniref:hypothetical protein n=1 Tax=Micromonospora lupini TaxID=285679 RepID=UPI00225AF929|nr:hypothetical protein [Micromonospora lupini]MCX5070805.1 hypothetical protein [Micromonospora lupini]